MKQSFLELISRKKNILVSSLRARTFDDVIFDINDSEEQGADAFLLHVELLDKEYQNIDTIKSIIDRAKKPMMVLNYRVDEDTLKKYRPNFDNTDVKRAERRTGRS